MNRYYTEEEMIFLKENYKKLSNKELAKSLNRSEKSINNKLYSMNLYKQKWTKEEMIFLEENAERGDRYLARSLNKSIASIRSKRTRMRIKSYRDLSASEVAKILKIDTKAVIRWKEFGLKMKKNDPSKISSPYKIKFEALIKFLKENKELWNANNVDLHGLGKEEKWLVEKRKEDLKRIWFRNWTKEEDARLIFLRNKGKSCADIGKELRRNTNAVSKRYCKLYYERKKKGEVNAI